VSDGQSSSEGSGDPSGQDDEDLRSIDVSSKSISLSSPQIRIEEPKMAGLAMRDKRKINKAQKRNPIIV
jgi:hypothetical protein